MLKKIFFLMLLFFILSFACVLANPMRQAEDTNNKPEEIHIYIPFEHQASLFMNADIISRSPKVKKVIWGYNRFEGKEEKYNVTHVGKQRLSNATEIQNGFLYSDLNELNRLYRKYPNAEYHIHTAIFMSLTRLIPILDIIPKKNIKQIDLYESSVGRTYQGNTYLWKNYYTFNKEELQTCIKYHCLKTWNLIFSLHLLYPTTYHLGLLSELKKDPKMQHFIEGTQTAVLEDMNIEKLKNSLTDDQKDVLLEVYDVDVNNYKKIIAKKKVHLFIIGHASDGIKDNEFEKLLVAIQDWKSQKTDPDALFFIKPGRDKSIMDKLRKAKVYIPEFPIQAPFELLVLKDLVPDSISGTSSSLFFNIPKEKIGKIYKTNEGNHLPLLEKIYGKEKVVAVH